MNRRTFLSWLGSIGAALGLGVKVSPAKAAPAAAVGPDWIRVVAEKGMITAWPRPGLLGGAEGDFVGPLRATPEEFYDLSKNDSFGDVIVREGGVIRIGGSVRSVTLFPKNPS